MPKPRTPSPPGRAPAWRGRAAQRACLALVCVAVLLSLLAGGPPRAQAQRGSLAGQLLVASEDMPDARFARAVIFVVKHDAAGAQGFVVNRPLREVPLAALMEQMGLPGAGAPGQIRLHAGGPVESFGIFALHTGEWSTPGTRAVAGGFAVTAQAEILRALAESRGPRRVIFLLGYAGWAPGQLETEMKGGYWLKAGVDEATLFDPDHELKWDRARARQKIDL
jgi:putative transcriptional regulator